VAPPLVIVNDRVEVALAAAADGVHVGAADMPVAEARARLGPAAVVGRTAHDIAAARAAIEAGADYLGVGPCFPSTTKSFASHAPREFLATAATLPLPVFAIGGITVARLAELAALGIGRAAVAAAVTAAADPAAAAQDLLAALGRSLAE
jgi:thiamine-phosphate pyrophosphorylase